MTDYRPISCAAHSQYELLVMQHTDITLNYQEQNGTHQRVVGVAVDLYARNGEEFIVMQTEAASTLTIRLDRIIDYHHNK